MFITIMLSIAMMVIILLGIFLRRYWIQLRQLQKEHKDACRLLERMSEAYYNQYNVHYSSLQ